MNLTCEEIETIRIHMNAFKETLCNQGRWIEAMEYQRIVDKLDNLYAERKKIESMEYRQIMDKLDNLYAERKEE